MRSVKAKPLKYIGSLDGLRALSAILIMAFHSTIPGLPGGYLAVDIFFVISGYLITRLLLREFEDTGTIDYQAFVSRRLRRLWPALLFMVAFYLFLAPCFFPSISWSRHWRDAVLSALYFINYAPSDDGVAVLRHTWSLAVEMQFYLVWPPLLILTLRLSRHGAIASMLVMYAGVSAWRCWSSANLSAWGFYPQMDSHSSGLILGCLLGYINTRISSYWSLPAIILLAFCMTFFSTGWQPSAFYGFTLAEIGAGILVLSQPRWLKIAPLAWLGKMSYGMYLWHYPIMHLVKDQHGWKWPEVMLLGFGLALLAATLSHYLLERRFYQSTFSKSRNGLA